MPPEVTPLNTWVPWVALLVAILAPLGPVWLTNRNAQRAKNAAEATAAKVVAESDRTTQKLDVIHKLVDGRLTAALDKIDTLEHHLLQTEGRTPTGEPRPPKPPRDVPYPEGSAT